jgi:hypothetical protein
MKRLKIKFKKITMLNFYQLRRQTVILPSIRLRYFWLALLHYMNLSVQESNNITLTWNIPVMLIK